MRRADEKDIAHMAKAIVAPFEAGGVFPRPTDMYALEIAQCFAACWNYMAEKQARAHFEEAQGDLVGRETSDKPPGY